MKKPNDSNTTPFYKLAKLTGNYPHQSPEYAAINPKTLLKCACKDCPVQCKCLCHILPQLARRRKYPSILKEHVGFFAVGAFWGIVVFYFWTALGGGDLILAAGLLGFFWLCHLLRFCMDVKWFPNEEALERLKK